MKQRLDPRKAIHIALTAIMLWLGFILALPGDTFALSPKVFRLLAKFATEPHWAMMFAGAGVIGCAGLYVPEWRIWSVLALSSAHGGLGLLLVCSTSLNTGSGTYCIVAGLGYWLAWDTIMYST